MHCSYPDQLAGVAAAFYADAGDLVLLRIDPARVPAEIRVEGGFPHVVRPDPGRGGHRGRAADPGRRPAASVRCPEPPRCRSWLLRRPRRVPSTRLLIFWNATSRA